MFDIIKILLIVAIDIAMIYCLKWLRPEWKTKWLRYVFGIQTVIALLVIAGNYVVGHFFLDYHIVIMKDYASSWLAIIYAGKAGFLAVQFLLWCCERRRLRHGKPVIPCLRKLFPMLGILTGLGGISLCLWSIYCERFNEQVRHVVIVLDDLPKAFDGFRIVQLSDLHAGSWYGHEEHIKGIVDLTNAQKADLLVFTGDFVNNFANEMNPLIPMLSRLHAPMGKIAILGNHDYSGYCDWDDPADSINNNKAIVKSLSESGLHLLANQSTVLQRDSAQIAIVGVENWGVKKRHPKLANLPAALKGVDSIPCKILLSHDPSFWPRFVRDRGDIALTLSGHTHGLQMGFRLNGKNYGPGTILYRYWSGLYHENGCYLYVNTGLGVGAFLGRVGMPPEITVIELRAK